MELVPFSLSCAPVRGPGAGCVSFCLVVNVVLFLLYLDGIRIIILLQCL